MKNLGFKSRLAAVGLGLALASSAALADVTYFPPVTAFEDDDLDVFLNLSATGTIVVGSRIRSVIEFNRTFGVFGGGPAGFGGDELTGLIDVTVLSKVANGDGTFDYTLGPTPGFGAAGTIVMLWLDPSPDLVIVPPNCASVAACEALASDGALYATAGFNGDPNQFFRVDNAGDLPSAFLSVPATTKIGTVNYALNVLINNTGQTFLPQLCLPLCPVGGDNSTQVIGSGDLLGGQGLTNGYSARSDIDFQVATRVPEPGSLALLALGLIGLGVSTRRRAA